MELKKTKNKCYTYFSIYGDFNIEEISRELDIAALDGWQATDEGIDVENRDSYLSCNKCTKYNIFSSKQMEETIKPFEDKIDLLNELKKKYNLKYSLSVVPFLSMGETPPSLSPNRKIIEFCYKTGTELIIDVNIDE